MSIRAVQDITIAEVKSGTYDATLLACGAEPRCTAFPSELDRNKIGDLIVLGFDDALSKASTRVANDAFFAKTFGKQPLNAPSNRQDVIFRFLERFAQAPSLRILVDYTCMSSLWYSAILVWAKYMRVGPTSVDLVYVPGRYQPSGLSEMVIHDILAIPGCEGGPLRFGKAVAVFGLGFQNWATLCLYERLEPDIAYSFLASPGSSADDVAKVKRLNREMIREHSRMAFDLPLHSVATTFAGLSEVISSHLAESDVTLVPMGPKPHVLASVLLSLRFDEVACLRVSGSRDYLGPTRARDERVVTRVTIRPAVARKSADEEPVPASAQIRTAAQQASTSTAS